MNFMTVFSLMLLPHPKKAGEIQHHAMTGVLHAGIPGLIPRTAWFPEQAIDSDTNVRVGRNP